MYFTYTLFTDILFIKSSWKTFQIFLKTPNNGHKMCEETMCNMWSCVFLFCNVQNYKYHGNLGFFVLKYHWKIFEIFLGLSVGTLYYLNQCWIILNWTLTNHFSEMRIIVHEASFKIMHMRILSKFLLFSFRPPSHQGWIAVKCP